MGGYQDNGGLVGLERHLAAVTQDLHSNSTRSSLAALWDQLLQGMAKKHWEMVSQQQRLAHARTRYLQKAILLHQIQQYVADGRSAQADGGAAARELAQRCKVAGIVQRLQLGGGDATEVITTPAPANVTPPSPDDTRLAGSRRHWLGLSPVQLLQTCDLSQTKSQVVVAAAAPAVSAALRQMLNHLAEALGGCELEASLSLGLVGETGGVSEPDPGPVWPGGLHTEPLGLEARVRQRQAALRHARIQASLGLQQQLAAAARLLDCLSAAINRLHVFLEVELAGRQQRQSQFLADLAGEHTRSLCHKVAHVEMQVLGHAYTPGNCSALLKVHAALAERAAHLGQQLQQVRSLVAAYEALGPDMAAVVAAYARVRAELHAAQQALTTFTELESELQLRDGDGSDAGLGLHA